MVIMALPWGFILHFMVLSVSSLAMLVLGCGSHSEGLRHCCLTTLLLLPLASNVECLKSHLYAVISGAGSDPQTGFLYDKHL